SLVLSTTKLFRINLRGDSGLMRCTLAGSVTESPRRCMNECFRSSERGDRDSSRSAPGATRLISQHGLHMKNAGSHPSPSFITSRGCDGSMERNHASGRLIIVCGLPGSGKTTHAKRLEQELRAIRFCPDEWIISLGGALWETNLRSRIEELQWK